jgi:hypothetical protein
MGPRDKTLEAPVVTGQTRCERCKLGYHLPGSRECDHCGSTDKYPAKVGRRGNPIGGKRGRNSGSTGSAKTKR